MFFAKRNKLQRFPSTQLTKTQIKRYREEGFLVFRHFLTQREVIRAKAAIREVVKRTVLSPELARYQQPDTLKDNQSGACYRSRSSNFSIRLEAGWNPEGRSWQEIEQHTRQLMNYHSEHQVFHQIGVSNVRLLKILGQLLNDYTVLYQSVAFVKPARIGRAKAWHQDNAYFRMADLNKVLGIWIALDQASVENGCMHVIPGGHKSGPMKHHHTTDCEIVAGRFDPDLAMPIELAPGGIIIFHSNLPHMTPPNKSSKRRRALQFHYRAESNEVLSFLEYESVFKEHDGTPASCAAAQQRGL